jgi:hypothetical protein
LQGFLALGCRSDVVEGPPGDYRVK